MEVTYSGSSHLLARLLRNDAVVDGQVHVAVDFENALKLADRLDKGRGVEETKELAQGTGALGGQRVEGPALDEALRNDSVDAMGWKSAFAQVLDQSVVEKEKGLDVLKALFDHLVETVDSKNLDQTLLVFRKVRGWNEGFHRHHKGRREGLRMERALEGGQVLHIKEKRLWARVRSELVLARDEREHSVGMHLDIGRVAPSEHVLRVSDGPVDPGRGALEREGAILELLVKLLALIVDAMKHHRGHEEREVGIGPVEAHDIEAIEEKLGMMAQGGGNLLLVLDVDRLERLPHGSGFLHALGQLDALDDVCDGGKQLLCAGPSVEARLGLLLDKGQIHELENPTVRAEVVEPAADFLEDFKKTHIERGVEPQLLFDTVEKLAFHRLVHDILRGAKQRNVKVKSGVQKQLMSRLLLREAHTKGSGTPRCALIHPLLHTLSELVVKGPERLTARDMFKLGAKTLNVEAKFLLHWRLLQLVIIIIRKKLEAFIEGKEGVRETDGKLALVRHLPGLVGLEVVPEQHVKVPGKPQGHMGEGQTCMDVLADALKGMEHGRPRVTDSLLQRAHRLEDVGGEVHHQRGYMENADIEIGRQRRQTPIMAQDDEPMDAMQARLGHSQSAGLAQIDLGLLKGHLLDARRGGAQTEKALHQASSRVAARVVPKALEDSRGLGAFHLCAGGAGRGIYEGQTLFWANFPSYFGHFFFWGGGNCLAESLDVEM